MSFLFIQQPNDESCGGGVGLAAHTDALEILADQSINVTSTHNAILVEAQQKIVLQAGQSAIVLEGGNITFTCPGTFSVKGVAHPFSGGGSDSAMLGALPSGIMALPPQTPLQTVYSQALDFTETSDAWLPFTLGGTVQSRSNGELLDSHGRTADDPITDGILTKAAANVTYWASAASVWHTEEVTFQPADDADNTNELENDNV